MSDSKEERPVLDSDQKKHLFTGALQDLQERLGKKRLDDDAIKAMNANFAAMVDNHDRYVSKLPELLAEGAKVQVEGMTPEDNKKLLEAMQVQGNDTIDAYLELVTDQSAPLGDLLEKGRNLQRFTKAMELTAKILENPLNAGTEGEELQQLASTIDDKFNHTTIKKWAVRIAVVVALAVLIGLTQGAACAVILPWAAGALTTTGSALGALGVVALTALSVVGISGYLHYAQGLEIGKLKNQVGLGTKGIEEQKQKNIEAAAFKEGEKLKESSTAGLDITKSFKERVEKKSLVDNTESAIKTARGHIGTAQDAVGDATKYVENKVGKFREEVREKGLTETLKSPFTRKP